MKTADRLLRLDDIRHINSPENIASLFKKIGYNASAQQLDKDEFELPQRSAKAVCDQYMIADHQKGSESLQILLFQLEPEEWLSPSTASNRMRSLAQTICKRPSEFLLLGTKDYNQLMLVNPRKDLNVSNDTLKINIRKLLIDRLNPTPFDRDRLDAIAARNLSPKQLYDVQCDAFDVEKLTKEFYRGYREIFEEVQRVIKENNPHPYFDDSSRLHQFSQRLLGRVMFLYFLQKKEFLGSDRDFLRNEYRKLKPEPKDADFYENLLEPLFFDTLNKQRPNHESPWGKIPYLNGGLFDKDYGVDIKDVSGLQTPPQIQLPNSLFDPSGDEKKSILKFFKGYNFTIAENIQGDEEVAVDPEMLGKVFENLLAPYERGQIGAFYTPRNIVYFMCVESLSRYLADSTSMDVEAIKKLIELDTEQSDTDFKKLLTKEQAKKLKKALETVKICDPAVGSGAFLLGMMHVILAAKQAIANREEEQPVQRGTLRMSEWKRDIIADNLYGVDIKPEAIEIAKLRMWLSIIVDIPTIDNVEPLPNLDYKLMCGDSLFSSINGEQLIPDPAEKKQQLKLNVTPIQDAIQPLVNLQHKFFESHADERKVLREEIIEAEKNVFRVAISDRRQYWETEQRNLIQDVRRMGKKGKNQTSNQQNIVTKLRELELFADDVERGIRSLNFFQWHLHFYEVFKQNKGFDIIIGNPPYDVLNMAEGHCITEEKLEQIRLDDTYQIALGGKLNLFRLFLAKSFKLSNSKGKNCFIIPYGFMCDSSSKKIRSYILENKSIAFIEAFPERDNPQTRLFESAKVSTCIVLLENFYLSKPFMIRTHYSRDIHANLSKNFLDRETIVLFDPQNLSIPLMSGQDLDIAKKMCKAGNRVADIGRCYEGEINLTFHKKYLHQELDQNMPMIKGAAVQKYMIVEKMSQGRVEFLDHKSYLKDFKSTKSQHYKYPRIVMQGITGVNESTRLKMTLLDKNVFCGNSVNYIILFDDSIDIRGVLGVLNSKILNWFFKMFSTNSNVNGYEVDNLPLPLLSEISKTPIVNLVQKLLDIRAFKKYLQQKDLQLEIDIIEDKINNIVYQLYGLTEIEIALIEKYA